MYKHQARPDLYLGGLDNQRNQVLALVLKARPDLNNERDIKYVSALIQATLLSHPLPYAQQQIPFVNYIAYIEERVLEKLKTPRSFQNQHHRQTIIDPNAPLQFQTRPNPQGFKRDNGTRTRRQFIRQQQTPTKFIKFHPTHHSNV